MPVAPAASSIGKCESGGVCFEPWNIRCSKRCAKPVRPALLVGGPDVIPEIHRHQRQPVILAEDHVEAVRQRELLERDFRDVRRGGRRAVLRGQRGHGREHGQRCGEDETRERIRVCMVRQSFVGALFRLAHKYQHATDR